MPLIAFHGGLDRIVPIDGGVRRLGSPLPAVAEWIASYARSCGCTTRSDEDLSDTITRVRYTGGRNGSEVVIDGSACQSVVQVSPCPTAIGTRWKVRSVSQ